MVSVQTASVWWLIVAVGMVNVGFSIAATLPLGRFMVELTDQTFDTIVRNRPSTGPKGFVLVEFYSALCGSLSSWLSSTAAPSQPFSLLW